MAVVKAKGVKPVAPKGGAPSVSPGIGIGDPRWLHDAPIEALCGGSDGLVVGCAGRELYLWDADGSLLHRAAPQVEWPGWCDLALAATDRPGRFLLRPTSTFEPAPLVVVETAGNRLSFTIVPWPAGEEEGYSTHARVEGDVLWLATSAHAREVGLPGGDVRRQRASPLDFAESNGVVLVPGGRLAIFGHWKTNALAWVDLHTGEQVAAAQAHKLHDQHGVVLACSPDGRVLATAYSNHYETTIELWDAATGAPVGKQTSYASSGSVMALAFSPDGRRLLAQLTGIDLLCFDLDLGRAIWHRPRVPSPAHFGFSGDGATVLLAAGRRIWRLDAATGERRATPDGLDGPAAGVRTLPEHGGLVAWSEGSVRCFHPASGRCLLDAPAHTVSANAAGILLLQRGRGYGVEHLALLDVSGRRARPLFTGDLRHPALAADGVLTAGGVGADGKSVRLRSRSGRDLGEVARMHPDTVEVAPDGRRAVLTEGRSLGLWDLRERAPVWQHKAAHKRRAERVFFVTPEILATSGDNWLKLWAMADGAPLLEVALPGACALVWQPPGGPLAAVLVGGEVLELDPAAGAARVVCRIQAGISAACEAGGARLWLGLDDATLARVDLSGWLRADAPEDAPIPAAEGRFVDWATVGGPAALARALDAADWSAFRPDRDLPLLRRHLDALARADGVGPLHRDVTARLRAAGARLGHRSVHRSPIGALALSPDGRYLATGSWVGEEYADGGAAQIWELESGRPVSAIDPVDGGVGWPGYGATMQWSPDGALLGMAYSTNSVGAFHPFDGISAPLSETAATNGWSRPPAWCWDPDGRRFFVACWGPSRVPGCVAGLARQEQTEADVTWMAPALPDRLPEGMQDEPHVEPHRTVTWTADGRILGFNTHDQAFAIDAASRTLTWLSRIGQPAAFSPDGALLAHCLVGLVFYDARTGLPTLQLPMILGASALHWAPVGRRLAVVVEADNDYDAEPGIHVYEDQELLCSLDLVPAGAGGRWDFVDPPLFAWSPDGRQGACLAGDRVEVFDVAAEPRRLRTLEVGAGAAGLYWGAAGRLVVVGKELLEFWDVEAGRQVSRYDLGRALAAAKAAGGHPLATAKVDFAARLDASPLVPVEADGVPAWAVVLGDGRVLCRASHRGALADELAWVVDRRHAWPAAWGDLDVTDDLGALLAAGDLPLTSAEKAVLLAGPKRPR